MKKRVLREKLKRKRCKECGLYLPLSEFHKQAGTKDGRRYVCKACRKRLGV